MTNGFHLFARCFHASSVKRYNFLNSNLHFKSKRRLPLGFFVELSRYCNVFHVLSKYFSSCTYHVEISKLPFLSKCRATILSKQSFCTPNLMASKTHVYKLPPSKDVSTVVLEKQSFVVNQCFDAMSFNLH